MNRVVCLLSLALGVVGQQSQCVIVQHGTGAQAGDGIHFPHAGDTVTIHYTGKLTNGVKFDSSYDRGKPFTTQIGVGQVIQGWDSGVPQLSLGETATLRISAACGYGAEGSPPVIPPNADLVFTVDLLGINGLTAGAAPAPAPAPLWAPAPQPVQTLQSWQPQPDFSAGLGGSFAGSQFGGSAQFGGSFGGQFGSQLSAEGSGDGSADLSAGWFPTPAPAPTAYHVGLPTCQAQQCGRAIAWDESALSTPLCLCNPLCQTMAGTSGVLPCCPGLQEVCLDPWRTPTPPTAAPTPQPVAQAWPQATQSQALTTPSWQSQPVQQTQAQPVAQPVAQPAQPVAHSGVIQLAQPQQQHPVQQQQPQQMRTPVAQAPHATPAPAPAAAPVQTAPAPATVTLVANQTVVAAPAAAVAPASAKLSAAVCTFSNTKWEAKKSCAEKRWTIRNGKCKKSCDAASPTAHAQYWPKTEAGRNACTKAADTCKTQ